MLMAILNTLFAYITTLKFISTAVHQPWLKYLKNL